MSHFTEFYAMKLENKSIIMAIRYGAGFCAVLTLTQTDYGVRYGELKIEVLG